MTSERTSEQNFKLNYISKDTMKAIKHLLWMLIALSMSISFAACGGDDNNDGNQDIPTPSPGPVLKQISIRCMSTKPGQSDGSIKITFWI